MNNRGRGVAGLKHELRDFAECLVISDFQPISVGVGLGELRKRLKMPLQGSKLQTLTSTSADSAVRPQLPNAVVRTVSFANVESPLGVDPKMASQPIQGLDRALTKQARFAGLFTAMGWFLGHMLDLILSGVAVFSMLFFVAMATQAVEPVVAIKVVRGWLQALTALERVAALYGTFLLYWLIFQGVVGRTIGMQLFSRTPSGTNEHSRYDLQVPTRNH